jgi:enoyl-CoA hydratase
MGGIAFGTEDLVTVVQERCGRVQIITLNRPEKRNALDAATTDALGNALLAAERDPDVAVVVLTGAGDRAFCAGLDLSTVGTRREPTEGSTRYMSFITDGYPKPVIAAVNGSAVAGGFELMLACDLAVAAQHATFGIPEVKRGLIAGAGGTLLPLRLPMPIALELGITGDAITAARAYELGLVNRVVPDAAHAFDEALALAERICQNSPAAVRATRALMFDTREMHASAAWDRIRDVLPSILAGADAQEGARAFLEKREPKWTTW